MQFLVLPGAPFFVAAFGFGLLMIAVALRSERFAILTISAQVQVSGATLGPKVTAADVNRRIVSGSLVGGLIAAVLIILSLATGASGQTQLMLLLGALLGFLYFGLVIPRRPLVAEQKRQVLVRRSTPGLVDFVRIGMATQESPLNVLRRYIEVPQAPRAAMQGVVAAALARAEDQRIRPFAALAEIAREREFRELLQAAEAMAQAEAEGTSVEVALNQIQSGLEFTLLSEFRRDLSRRTLILIGVSAIAVVWIPAHILFVMTEGGRLFTNLFGGG